MKRSAEAKWIGDLKTGKGLINTESGTMTEQPYSFGTRFEQTRGTNPEELLAAAHASCFAMALSSELGKSGIAFDEIHTTADVNIEKQDSGWKIIEVHLVAQGSVKSEDQEKFILAANKAKENCPVSRLLNAPITLEVSAEQPRGKGQIRSQLNENEKGARH